MQSIDFFQVMKWKSMDAKDWIFFIIIIFNVLFVFVSGFSLKYKLM